MLRSKEYFDNHVTQVAVFDLHNQHVNHKHVSRNEQRPLMARLMQKKRKEKKNDCSSKVMIKSEDDLPGQAGKLIF